MSYDIRSEYEGSNQMVMDLLRIQLTQEQNKLDESDPVLFSCHPSYIVYKPELTFANNMLLVCKCTFDPGDNIFSLKKKNSIN